MIILFTSNTEGGMLHFVITLLRELTALKKDALCFLPEGSTFTIEESLKNRLVFYDKFRTVNLKDSRIISLKAEILSKNPDVLWYGDSSILSMQLSILLKDQCKQVLSLHDAGNYHPTRKISIKDRLQRIYTDSLLKKSISSITDLQTLSKGCEEICINRFPKYKDKISCMNLGALVPDVAESMPEEMANITGPFYLFFGRIDKYKGIHNILEAYLQMSNPKLPLIIAGNGTFTDEENKLIGLDENIHPINRYIQDGEMLWLLSHSKCLTLPYIEATQSGVLPMGYFYGKPAITSSVLGLSQFVDHEKTGFICSSTNDYIRAMNTVLDEEKYKDLCKNAKAYYEEHLDNRTNINRFLEHLL